MKCPGCGEEHGTKKQYLSCCQRAQQDAWEEMQRQLEELDRQGGIAEVDFNA